MRYSISGEELAKLIIAAGARMDADEIGEIVHSVRPISELVDAVPAAEGYESASEYLFPQAVPPAKPE